jgi:Flp pilus assembly protein TadD
VRNLAQPSSIPQKALALYRGAVEVTSDDALLNFKLAMTLDRTDDTAAEQVALQQVMKIDPTFALAHNQVGYLASRDGDFASAEEHFRLALRSAPGYAEAWVNLAAALGMELRFPEALDAVANAIKLDPKSDQARQVRQKLRDAQSQRCQFVESCIRNTRRSGVLLYAGYQRQR